ncbi:MAG: redoxin domain-containing protein [Alphaproteobacteria bacterium]
MAEFILNRRALGRAAALVATAALTAGALIASSASAAVETGKAAPVFAALDTGGATVKLADYRGRIVVLEWTNDGCPYVRKHYQSGNMQKLQKEATADGVVWLTIISSAPGQQGYADGARADKLTSDRGAAPTDVLLDPKGAVGHLYNAKTTPHMFIIDKNGTLVYQGAIDDKPTTNPADLAVAKNYVRAALAEMKAGQPVTTKATVAYGCTVKYD